jgi:uncharacterized BrkB/YihY/UPF0761 family membrane protein
VSVTTDPDTPAKDPFRAKPAIYVRIWGSLVRTVGPTLGLMVETEAHVYAFSIAANVLLSFFPFLLTMVMLCRTVFHWEAGVKAIFFAVTQVFPNYKHGAYLDIAGFLNTMSRTRDHVSLFSILLLFLTANGMFEPLEVALNRAWRVKKNRSYLRNQLVSLGLVFFCGVLMMLAIGLIAWNGSLAQDSGVNAGFFTRSVVLKVTAVLTFSLAIFTVYWILPNRRIPIKRLIPVSILVGLILVFLNVVYLKTWPWLLMKLRSEEGPFVESASIILWAFIGSLVLLAGAEWSARTVVTEELVE